MELPKARLVTIKKWQSVPGYGFNVKHVKSSKEYRIEKVEAGMPAESAGILAQDIIVEVNGVSTSCLSH